MNQESKRKRTRRQGKVGRPTILQREGLTLSEVFLTYQEEGTYKRVADRLGISHRSAGTYMRAARQAVRQAIATHIQKHTALRGTNLSLPTSQIRRWELSPVPLPGHAVIDVTLQGGRTLAVHMKISRPGETRQNVTERQ